MFLKHQQNITTEYFQPISCKTRIFHPNFTSLSSKTKCTIKFKDAIFNYTQKNFLKYLMFKNGTIFLKNTNKKN